MANVFEKPTASQLAHIMTDESEENKFAILMGGVGSGRPVFFLQGITRNALVFRSLIKHINPWRPCYGLELPDALDEEEPLISVEELAGHCVNEILQIQPNGPYNIGGYSFGGLIAFETASQLQEKSGEKAKVFVFDSRLRVQKRYSVFQRIKWALNLFRQERFNYMRYVARELGNQVGQRFGLTDKTPIQKIFERTIGNVKRIKSDPYHKKYLPRPCPVEVVVLTARDTEYEYPVEMKSSFGVELL